MGRFLNLQIFSHECFNFPTTSEVNPHNLIPLLYKCNSLNAIFSDSLPFLCSECCHSIRTSSFSTHSLGGQVLCKSRPMLQKNFHCFLKKLIMMNAFFLISSLSFARLRVLFSSYNKTRSKLFASGLPTLAPDTRQSTYPFRLSRNCAEDFD